MLAKHTYMRTRIKESAETIQLSNHGITVKRNRHEDYRNLRITDEDSIKQIKMKKKNQNGIRQKSHEDYRTWTLLYKNNMIKSINL